MFPRTARLALILLTGSLAACAGIDRAAGTNTSGAYPAQSDGTPSNPPGTAVTRSFDRAAGTNTSGAYPSQSDGTPRNPRGTAATRTVDRAACTNLSGAYPGQRAAGC